MIRVLRLLALLLAGAALWSAGADDAGDARVPARILLEDTTADLSPTFSREAVVTEAADAPVRAGALQPGYDANRSRRRALVASPPATLRFRADVPEDAVLRFDVGIESPRRRDDTVVGVEFRASIDGRPVYTRLVNPAARKGDRQWLRGRIDLTPWAGRSVEIVLDTKAEKPGPLAGTPGWSDIRIVRTRWQDRQPARPGAPNVLVLLVDTLRMDALGAYGAPKDRTPAFDALAARGVVFEQAIAHSSWTMPSVASILTGLLPRSHGVIGGTRAFGKAPMDLTNADPAFLAGSLTTIAEAAQHAGITTLGISTNLLVSSSTNFSQGFETFVQLHDFYSTKKFTRAAAVNTRFLRWLRANRDRRFFAYLHYMDVHGPYDPPKQFRPVPGPDVSEAVAKGEIARLARQVNFRKIPQLSAPDVAYLRALYDAEVRGWDVQLRSLLDTLASEGVLDDTIVLITADHGEEFQEHGHLTHGIDLYDELIRVPLVVAGPGIAPGRVAVTAQGVDLFPTIAAWLGVPVPKELPGQNLLANPQPRPVMSETSQAILAGGELSDLVSLREPTWKLIQAPQTGHDEVFDLATDPGEHRNLAPASPEGPRLTGLLRAIIEHAPPPPLVSGADPGLHDKLRALGYVE